MYIWSIAWLMLKLEMFIGMGFGEMRMFHLLPYFCLTLSRKDHAGNRFFALTTGWWVFRIELSYCMSYMDVYNEEGTEIVSKKYGPEYSVERTKFHI